MSDVQLLVDIAIQAMRGNMTQHASPSLLTRTKSVNRKIRDESMQGGDLLVTRPIAQ